MNNNSFQELGLSAKMMKSLDALGFIETTPVQSQAILPALQKNDVLVQSPTGTGKTCAFCIPIIENISNDIKGIQALILCPNRELVLQTTSVLRQLTKFNSDIKIAPIYGGDRIDRQIISLRKRPQVVVATPGRAMDFIQRKVLKFDELQTVVLDEADRMLDMGFRDDLNTILEATPTERQTVLFSATISKEVEKIAENYLNNPLNIKIKPESSDSSVIEHFYSQVRDHHKIPTLLKLLRDQQFTRSLVFVGTKSMVDTITQQLVAAGILAGALHGDLRQSRRDYVMNQYRTGAIDVLVATDVAARGIDVNNISAVINFDIPQNSEDYIHRIGRTGRAQNSGQAYTFIYAKEHYKLRDIINSTKIAINPFKIVLPTKDTTREISRETSRDSHKTKKRFDEKFEKRKSFEFEKPSTKTNAKTTIDFEKIKRTKPNPETKPADEQPKKRQFNRNEFDKPLNNLADKKEKTFSTSSSDKTSSKTIHNDASPHARMFISLGTLDKLSRKDFADLISSKGNVPQKQIGTISIHESYSFFQIPQEYVSKVKDGFKGASHNKRLITVDVSKGTGGEKVKRKFK